MKKYFDSWWEILALGLILVLLAKGWFFGIFIDEQENFVGGWLISQGLVIYRDFFLHHTPLPYFISSLLFLFGHPPWWVWRLFTLSYLLTVGAMLWRLAAKKLKPSLLLTAVLLAIAAPKLNLQMFLADTLFAISFLGAAVLAVSYWRYKTPGFTATFKWLLFFCFVSGWSTIVSLPPFALLLMGVLWQERRWHQSWQLIWQSIRRPIGWFLLTNSIFPLYFLLNRGLAAFWWATISYNQQYYFPLRLAESSAEQQWGAFYYSFSRLISLLMSQGQFIWQTVWKFLLTAKGLAFSLGSISSLAEFWQQVIVWLVTPISTLAADVFTVLALGFWSLSLTFIWQRKWSALAALFIFSGLLFIRSNEIFHLSAFLGLIFGLVSVVWLNALRAKHRGQAALLGLFLLVGLNHFWPSYQEQLFNRSAIISPAQLTLATQINQSSQPSDKLQVIGGGLTYYLLAERLPAGRVFFYYPWLQPAELLRDDLLATLTNQRAQLVLLEEQFDAELVETLKTYYSEGEQGIYRPKNLDEIRY